MYALVSSSTSPSFLFRCYGDPRDLHSFPTRRSSDLFWPPCWPAPRRPGRSSPGPWPRPRPTPVPPRTGVPPSPQRSPRSEEHTSELQSLTNLVCRLLLEKKKHKYKSQQCTMLMNHHQ